MTTPAPHWFDRITAELDQADERALAIAQHLSVDQLNWKPAPHAWSVGQCLEHLCLSNEVYVEPITAAIEANAATGPVHEITPGWFSRWFMKKYIEPTTQRSKARAPRKAAPAESDVDPSMLDRFIASNAAIHDVMARARSYDVNRVRFRNPYVSVIRFTIGTGFQIVARHNFRHLNQAERVTRHPAFPKSATG